MISKKIHTFDILLFLIPVLLLIVSLSVIYSLVVGTNDSELILKQIVSALIAIVMAVGVCFVDYRFFKSVNWILYILGILLLIYVDFFGKEAGGAMRWINMGFFQLQPSELAKFFIILSLASFFAPKIRKISWKDIFFSVLILIPPLLLILKEPDLGTALVIGFIYIVVLFYSRPTKIQSFLVISMILLSFAVAILAVKNVSPFGRLMHDYQKNRILTFIDPDRDPYGQGYNVRQAQITVGSGGITGKGLGRGTQSQLQFLPKPHTDFIFAGIAESFGFLGMLVFLAIIALLILRILSISVEARDNFGMLICIGAAAMFFFQATINIAMNLGYAPVTGIPLPFSSYGGSALITYFFILGIVQSIFIRHKKISF